MRILVDGNNRYRQAIAAPGLSSLTDSKGNPTGGIHGTLTTIKELVTTYKPDELVIVFDGSGASEEKRKIYAPYKAGRSKMDAATIKQFKVLVSLLPELGFCVFHETKKDADDVIATLVAKKGNTIIVSNDKDFLQLASDKVSILRDRVMYTPQTVMEKFGVTPAQFVDYLTLVGDGADGIPGLAKCGPVGAKNLLSIYGKLGSAIRQKAETPKNLLSSSSDLAIFRKLIKLDSNYVSPNVVNSLDMKINAYTPNGLTTLRKLGLVNVYNWMVESKPTLASMF